MCAGLVQSVVSSISTIIHLLSDCRTVPIVFTDIALYKGMKSDQILRKIIKINAGNMNLKESIEHESAR